MPVERRGTGRWKRERHTQARDPAVSDRRAAVSARRRNPRPVGVGGSECVDGAHVTGPGNRVGKGGKWFRLIDKVWSEKNLRSALGKVVAGGGSAGMDDRSVWAVERQSEEEIALVQKQLREIAIGLCR